MFNVQLFRAMAEVLQSTGNKAAGAGAHLTNICLVPEWRVWRWAAIRRWAAPLATPFNTRYVPVFYLPLVGRNWNDRLYSLSLGKLTGAIEGHDAVFSTWLYPDGVVAAKLAETCGLPSWIMVLGTDVRHLDHSPRRAGLLEACRKAGGIICVCRSLADRLTAAGVDPAKVHTVPNGVDKSLFHYRPKSEAVQRLATSFSSGRVVLFVGNLVQVKGPDIMLQAFAKAARSFSALPNSRKPKLVTVGDGPMRKHLQRQAVELGVGDMVTFLGNRPHDETALWMNAADCLCLTSRGEGMPNVVLEALASGLPVVATDVGACAEMLDKEPAARVVESEDAGAIASALAEMLSSDRDREAMAGRHGEFGWQDQAREILALLRTDGPE